MHVTAARLTRVPRFSSRGSRVSMGGQKSNGTCILDACGPTAAPLGVMP